MDNEKFVTRSRQWRETVSILLVEDDTTFAEMVRAQLRRMPWVEARLEIASTLRAALEKMAVEPFGLVVADLNLPDSKGLDTLAALSRVGDQPILILSGDKDPAVRAGVIDGGAYDFLSKDNLSAAALERLVRLASIQANTYSLVRETEARFQGLLKLSSEWYWEQDEELRFSRYDGPAGERAGNQPQATIGKHRWEIEGVTPVSSSWDEHRRQLEARQPFRDFEYSRISEDGVRYVAVSGEPLFDARGEFRGYRGIARDVTDRKRADEELQRFRLAMDSSADMIVLIDRASMRFVDVNRTACALLGYTREELLAMSPDQVLPVSRAELEKAYDEFIADPSRITGMSSYYRCKDGSTLPFESTRRVLRSGSSWIIAAISRDIRERIAVEKALHDSNERFRSLNALSSDWYWEQDSEFRLTFMSSIEKLGLDPTKYLGGRRWDQPALNLGEADWARHRAQLERHEPFQDFEMERPGESGTVWLSLSGQPVFDEAGRFTGYRGIGRDITERKREERLKGLEHAVTRYLAEADDERGALQGVMRVVCETEKWDCGRYYDMDGDAGVLRLLEAWATPASGVEKALEASRAVTFEPGVGLGGRAWQTGEPLWIADIQNDPRAGKRVLLRDSGMRGGFAFPVIAGGAPIGSLVFNAREVRPPEQRLLQATRVIGSQVGQFLQRKRAESKAGRLARMNVALAAANEAILRAKTSQEAFERACQIAVEAGSFLIGTVFVIDPKTRTLSRAAANGRAAELVHPVQPTFDTADPAGKGLIGEACRTGRPAISNDYDADPRTASVQPRAYEVGSAAVFPLHVDGELFGVFGLQHAQRGAFSEELTALLQRLADNIAFALETFRANKRRRAAKRKLAESEQRFRSLTGLSSDMYWEQDEEHRFTALSDSGPKALNSWRRQNMVGKRRWDQRYFNMTEAGWEAHRAKLAAREPFFDLELGRFNEAGEKVWVTVSGEPFFDEAGKFRGYRGIGKEITERKRAAQLRELEHSVTRSLAEANSVSEALRGAMRAVCETEGWECGRFYYADDKTGLLHLGESWGVEGEAVQRYLAGMRDITYALGTGLTGRVWQSGEPLWVRDIHNDSRVAQAGLAREADIHGAFIFPALSEGRTMGVLAFNSRDIRQPEEDLLQAVGVIGSQIGQYLQRKEVEASRLRDEEALRRFRAAMDTSGDIILLIDRETMRYVDVNVTACERIGYTREEIMALGPEQLTPIPRAELERAYDAIIESGEITTVRGVQFCKNRPSFPTEVMRRSVRSGGRWLIVAVVRDITQRLAAEEALGRSEARFRSLTNLSSDWYWEQDAEFRFTKFEGKGSAEGYSPASLIIGKCIWDLPGIVAGTVHWAAHRTTLERHESFRNIQYSYRVRSGAVFYVSVDGEPVFDDSGRFLGYRGTSRDITRQRRDEEELRRFRAAMDMSLDAIYLTDRASMRFIDVNAAACRGIGRTRAEMLEMGPHDLLQETRASLEAEYDAVIAQGDVGTRSETSYSAKDGTRRWTELHRRALRADESWIIVSISRDITERKRAEQRQAQYVRHQERVARFGQSALAKREPGELVREAVQNVLEGLAADAVAYFERGKGDTELILHALVGAGEGGDGTAVKCGESNPVQRVLRSGAAQVVDGAELEFDWATGLHAAVIPVRGERNARGALCVCYRAASAFAADALNFVEAVASVLSAGLQRIESESRLAFLAQFDSLTGLPNRALLADRFSQMIVLAKRRSASLSVLFVDLDEFKMVNDTLGHSGGDQLLKEVAVRLQACVRSGDTVARISGDEFAVILADMAQPEDAAIVAQKIIDRLAAAFEVHGNEVFISGSIGIAAYPGDGADAEALIGAADAAMYRAKQAGRNNFQFFTAEINQRTRNRALLGTELRRALEREEFVLYYQPKVELANRRFYGAEALIRWKHPERGLVSPAEFIPVLEETGLIVPVGEWVLKRACEDLKAWQAAGLDVGPVAVNLSARQFRLQDLDARLKAVVAETGIDPSLIELEITESQLMVDPDHAIRVMRSLCDAGMRISIDDFGTGYSSLAYLTRFPVGALKIDRSFVADVNKDPSDATIVRTIIEMAHSLGFTVVAEGVETEDQATFLRLLRCERAQGYLFAKPMPAADLVKLFSPKAS